MTKRAGIIIGIILLIPILITLIALARWKGDNPVVAEYGDTIREIRYEGQTLCAVGEPDTYMAEPGTFLGKVGDSLTGAGLYTVKYDESGSMWALVTEKGTVLFNAAGRLPAAALGGSSVTAVFFDRFTHRMTDTKQIAALQAVIDGKKATKSCTGEALETMDAYVLHVCYDGSAVSTVSPGKFLHEAETGMWYFLGQSGEEAVRAEISSGAVAAADAVYALVPVTDASALRILANLLPGSSGTPVNSSAESTKGAVQKDLSLSATPQSQNEKRVHAVRIPENRAESHNLQKIHNDCANCTIVFYYFGFFTKK